MTLSFPSPFSSPLSSPFGSPVRTPGNRMPVNRSIDENRENGNDGSRTPPRTEEKSPFSFQKIYKTPDKSCSPLKRRKFTSSFTSSVRTPRTEESSLCFQKIYKTPEKSYSPLKRMEILSNVVFRLMSAPSVSS